MKIARKIWKYMVVVPILSLLLTTGALAAETTLSGTIEKDFEGIVFSGANGERYVIFNKDLSEWVGRAVEVTGVIEEGPYGKSIRVITVQKIGE